MPIDRLFFVARVYFLKNIRVTMFYLYLWIAAQIIIEMLPISSSGHLQLLQLWLKKHAGFDIHKIFAYPSDLKTVYYFLHAPTLLLISFYFFSDWLHLFFNNGSFNWKTAFCFILADSITAALFIIWKKYEPRFPLGLGFCITAAALFATAWCAGMRSIEFLSLSDALILGFAQGMALLPGISRLAFTCSIGCALGFSLYDAFFISWTLQAPLMAAAFIKSLKDLHQPAVRRQVLNLTAGLVMLGSSGISIFFMQQVLRMAKNNTWYFFGWYMFVPLLIWTYMVRYDC
jgi:undecaprenyl-diphosphatase